MVGEDLVEQGAPALGHTQALVEPADAVHDGVRLLAAYLGRLPGARRRAATVARAHDRSQNPGPMGWS